MRKRIEITDEEINNFIAKITAENQVRAAKLQQYMDLVIEAQNRIVKLEEMISSFPHPLVHFGLAQRSARFTIQPQLLVK